MLIAKLKFMLFLLTLWFQTWLTHVENPPLMHSLTLVDRTRHQRPIPINIYYPEHIQGKLPLIIFSPGAGGSKDSSRYLTEAWATHGYIVISLSHQGSDTEMFRKYGFKLLKHVIEPDRLDARPRDVSFVLDSLPSITQQIPDLWDHLDTRHIGMSGYSLGAYTSSVLAGALVYRDKHPNKPQTFKDKRLSCFMMISPQGPDQLGFKKNSWKNIHAPTMLVSGSNDYSIKGSSSGFVPNLEFPPSWRKKAFELMPGPNLYWVSIQGAKHISFYGVLDPKGTELVKPKLQPISRTFWDAYLKQNPQALAYLKQNNPAKIPGVAFEQK